MHARNRTWTLGSDPAERCRQRTLPVEGGDGSTLSLDFTTGVLDPRLTFTRSTNATFINSSGQVQWAAANEFRNTGWVTSTTPTGWNVTFGTGTTTWNNDGTLTMNTGGSSTRPCINANSFTVSQGIAYTFGYTVVSASGSPQISNVISSTVAGETFAINGATVGPTTVVQAGDVVSCTFTPTGTTAIPRMGPGVNVGMTNTAMTITRPQMNPGLTLQPYLLNTSTSVANNNTPRFDYDPTAIGTPRGLLIEGSATNLLKYSAYADTFWIAYGGYTKAYTTGITSPAGDTSAVRVTFDAVGKGLYTNNTQMGYTNSVGAAYTFSAWIRATSSTTNAKIRFGDSAVATGPDIPISTTWTRYSYQYTAVTNSGPLIQSASGTATGEFEMWGMQLEAGSGASSYIPSGASQGSRAADFCYQDGISSWFTSQSSLTMLVDATPRVQTSFPVLWILTDAGGGNSYQLYYTSSGTTNSYTTKVNVGFSGTSESTLASSVQQDTRQIIGYAIASGVGVRSRNGVSGTAAVASSLPTTALTRLGVGSTGSGLPANAHIRRIKYWPYALTQAQLNGATTT